MSEILYGFHTIYHLLRVARRRTTAIHLLKSGEVDDSGILGLAKERGVPVYSGSPRLFSSLRGAVHQGIAAEVDPYPYKNIDEIIGGGPLLLLEGIQDPQNLGALCRSAYLLGFTGIILQEHRAVSITAAACKVAEGATEYLEIAKVPSIANAINILKKKGYWIYGMDSDGEKSLYDEIFSGQAALVVGGEGEGLSRLVRERCDLILRIPMVSDDRWSLNASVTGAIAMSEILRQNIKKPSRKS